MWGIIPAAGSGTRIQPLAFSKELLPVGGRIDGAVERPRAISEYLVDRMIVGGASKLCFVISPGKSDILEYYGGGQLDSVTISFVVQPQASGLCDAIFQAAERLDSDAICLGTHGRRGMTKALLGSVTEAVIRETRRPVLLSGRSKP